MAHPNATATRARRVAPIAAAKLSRFIVSLPYCSLNPSEAYVITDRETRGAIAVVLLDGDGGLVAKMRRAKRQADIMCDALNQQQTKEGEQPWPIS